MAKEIRNDNMQKLKDKILPLIHRCNNTKYSDMNILLRLFRGNVFVCKDKKLENKYYEICYSGDYFKQIEDPNSELHNLELEMERNAYSLKRVLDIDNVTSIRGVGSAIEEVIIKMQQIIIEENLE